MSARDSRKFLVPVQCCEDAEGSQHNPNIKPTLHVEKACYNSESWDAPGDYGAPVGHPIQQRLSDNRQDGYEHDMIL